MHKYVFVQNCESLKKLKNKKGCVVILVTKNGNCLTFA